MKLRVACVFSVIFLSIVLPVWIAPHSRSSKAPRVMENNVYGQSNTFYAGKTVTIITFDSVGGYNIWARFLARHMPKYIPGNPNFIVQNMPGAASLIATNYVYNAAKPDGLSVGMPNQRIYMSQLLGDKETKFDIRKFNWIGSPDRNPSILYMRADAPYQSIDHVIKAKIPPKCGGTGWESSSVVLALEETLGAKFELVLGYSEARQVDLAVERGEVVCRSIGLPAHFSREPFNTWHANGFDRHILQTGRKRDARAPDTPTIFELMDRYAAHEVNRRLIQVLTAGEDFGHPMMAPPGTPQERVNVLREAYAKALKDPDLLAEAQKGQWDIDPVTGEELQALARQVVVQPIEVVEQVKRILKSK
jgi:tripartite-type tricarboxylate transporter receptor subunit TctC